jgi:hypothetical protein
MLHASDPNFRIWIRLYGESGSGSGFISESGSGSGLESGSRPRFSRSSFRKDNPAFQNEIPSVLFLQVILIFLSPHPDLDQ